MADALSDFLTARTPGALVSSDDPIFAPNNSPITPSKQVGPWTNPSTDASFAPGSPIPGGAAPAPGLLSFFLNRGLPLPLATIYAAMYPTEANTGEAPRQTLGRKPSGPGAPLPRAIGSDANFPVMGASGFPGTYAAPGQQPPMPTAPAATTGVFNSPADSSVRPPPRPAIDPRHVDLGYYQNPRFTTIDRPNAPAAGNARGGGGPVNPMGALDLSGLFKRGQS